MEIFNLPQRPTSQTSLILYVITSFSQLKSWICGVLSVSFIGHFRCDKVRYGTVSSPFIDKHLKKTFFKQEWAGPPKNTPTTDLLKVRLHAFEIKKWIEFLTDLRLIFNIIYYHSKPQAAITNRTQDRGHRTRLPPSWTRNMTVDW